CRNNHVALRKSPEPGGADLDRVLAGVERRRVVLTRGRRGRLHHGVGGMVSNTISAPGTAAPVESDTTPVIFPRSDCANRIEADKTRSTIFFMMDTPLCGLTAVF